ncbi:PREDICTED: transcription factor RFX4-like isoform X2 [Priapulus caudatus]|uniref:Transcription factor RFX4-like isoform X2 n=1 Tax=Priapulus caudatus TaxID=37621 RepID=A0ABM1FAM3_PRICU|nr:PREDICTED: transcription factor RFX4-like isoform X2 [Priapulus caudatus]
MIIRQQFPQITTRRLGTRGQSKYHYYGIAIKEESLYYETMYSAHGAYSNMNEGKKDATKQALSFVPRAKVGTLLPEFPSAKDIMVPTGVEDDKIATFLMMYRTHCQRILDTVIRANFSEIRDFLVHYWQGMPVHMTSLLGSTVIVQLVSVCDSITYRALLDVLIPSVLHTVPESLADAMRKFSADLECWLETALHGLPDDLHVTKFRAARRFSELLQRQFSLTQLCQTARSIVINTDIVAAILSDLRRIDVREICCQVLYTAAIELGYSLCREKLAAYYREFEALLEEKSGIDDYIAWADSILKRCFQQMSKGRQEMCIRYFIHLWMYFGSKISRELTLHNSQSFGSFQVLRMMFDDYLLLQLHLQQDQIESDNTLCCLAGQDLPIEPNDPPLQYFNNPLFDPTWNSVNTFSQGCTDRWCGGALMYTDASQQDDAGDFWRPSCRFSPITSEQFLPDNNIIT